MALDIKARGKGLNQRKKLVAKVIKFPFLKLREIEKYFIFQTVKF